MIRGDIVPRLEHLLASAKTDNTIIGEMVQVLAPLLEDALAEIRTQRQAHDMWFARAFDLEINCECGKTDVPA